MEKIEFDKKLGAYVQQLRKEKGWTQQELATKLGTAKPNISRLEHGDTSPTFYWISNLAKAFEIGLGEFTVGFESYFFSTEDK